MKKLLLLLALTAALPTAAMAQATDEEPEKVSIQKDESIPQHRAVTRSAGREGVTATLHYVRLPDMKKPRAHHQTFVYKDYLVIVGGLSTGGKPTATAEMINYTSSGHSWTGYDLKNTHVDAFAVKRRLPESGAGIPVSSYIIGGGLIDPIANAEEASEATTVPYFFVLGSLYSFTNGPKLCTPRAYARGIYVNRKTYISGNYWGDDSTMEVLEEGATEFKPVGKTKRRLSPYMFADTLGRVMALSTHNPEWQDFGYETDSDGSPVLKGDVYNPATDATTTLSIPYSPEYHPMLLPYDAKSEDYRYTINDSRRYAILTELTGGYMLHGLDLDRRALYTYDDFIIPTKYAATGEDIKWRGSVIADTNRQQLYLIGVTGADGNQTVHIISYNYANGDWTMASAGGFKENMWNAAWTKLGDGRIACTGGVFDMAPPFASAYIFNPPLAGTTEVVEPEDSGEGGEGGESGEGLCVVVESTNGEKARYLLEEEPRFYMKGETVTVATTKVTIDYQTDAIARVYLENNATVDIDDSKLPTLKEGSMSFEAGRIVITGLEPGETATVYQLSGSPVASAKADPEGRIVISIDGTPGKVSIIKTKHQSFKIIRK